MPETDSQLRFRPDEKPLYVAAAWVERHCVVPDGFDKGKPFELADWQGWCLLNYYLLKPTAQVGQLASAFKWRRSQIVLPQKAGKAPYSAAHICLEGVGPALFAGWAEGGEVWDCSEHGCGCGWVYEYRPGEGMGMAWPTPLIQVTAYVEDQTDNIYSALRPMIELGPLSEVIPKTGEEFIRLPNGGRIDTVTSNAKSRLGGRVTFAPQDETGIWLETHGMVELARTQRRGLSGMGGRAEETTNGWDPNEKSVAQRTAEAAAEDIFRFHPQAPENLDYLDPVQRREIHDYVYRGSPWVDLDGVDAEAAEMVEDDPGEAERFFGNRIVAGAAKAFDAVAYRELRHDDRSVAPGELVTLGFDGARRRDATGLVVTGVKSGHQEVVAVWERPRGIPDDAEWEIPFSEVNDAVEMAFSRWNVWRFYLDPPHWDDAADAWAGRYGDDKVVFWWTNSKKKMAYALRTFKQDMDPERMSFGGEDADRLVEHIGNAVKSLQKMRDEEDRPLWLIRKEGSDSKKKIDLAMAACLSWEARGDAIKSGALNEPEYSRAAW